MSELIADCPRCAVARITFDITAATPTVAHSGWITSYEAFGVCRMCSRATVFLLDLNGVDKAGEIQRGGGSLANYKGTVNHMLEVSGFVSVRDTATVQPPEFVPTDIAAVFAEGATCLAVGCYNAAGTMFRLCIDLATKGILPENNENGLSSPVRRNLGLRLPWLFEQRLLPLDLQDLSSCIKDDGNDGAHDGTLTKADAEDILDFTEAMLERMFTEPERIRQAKARREQRRAS